MPGPLTGKTITVTTSRSLTPAEMARTIEGAFRGTQCPTCTSGGHFILHEETELPMDKTLNARAGISEQTEV